MEHRKHSGASLAIVLIICAAISIILASTFLVIRNYNIGIIRRKIELPCKVNLEENLEHCKDIEYSGVK